MACAHAHFEMRHARMKCRRGLRKHEPHTVLLVGYHGEPKASLFIMSGLYRDYTTPKGSRLPTLLLGCHEPDTPVLGVGIDRN